MHSSITVAPRHVIAALRRIVRLQVCDSAIRRDVQTFIQDNHLLTESHWPAYVVRLSDAGRDFIQEYGDAE